MTNAVKTILVTGATGGIGQAACNRLSKAGFFLILAARNTEKLDGLCGTLSKATPGTYSWIAVYMSSNDSVSVFARELTARNVALDGAVPMPPQPHSTGDCPPPDDVWRDTFQNSFISLLAVLKAAIGTMTYRMDY